MKTEAPAQSALVLGTAQLGPHYGVANRAGRPADATVRALLTAAADLGVTHLDTARAYGDSEERIGALVGDLPLRFVTKVAPQGPDATPASVRASVTRSLAALRRPGPHTLLLHRAADAAVGWPVLQEYAATRAADRIGVSVQSPDELRSALALPDLGYVQLPCNVLDRRWLAPDLAALFAARPDLIVTVRSVYLQGLLTAGRTVVWPHLRAGARDALVDTLDRLAVELGRADRADLCVAYVRSLPWVTSIVVGAETEEQLRRNAWLAARPPLTPAEGAAVRATLPDVPAALLDPAQWP
ncbi:aldo/keto reductase [Luedemannella helvata]|uniref:aldo/keto reductase n=1 Tax=Luedemannella helvata TaxID=349315 RepID=UPI0031DCF6B9